MLIQEFKDSWEKSPLDCYNQTGITLPYLPEDRNWINVTLYLLIVYVIFHETEQIPNSIITKDATCIFILICMYYFIKCIPANKKLLTQPNLNKGWFCQGTQNMLNKRQRILISTMILLFSTYTFVGRNQNWKKTPNTLGKTEKREGKLV